MKLIQYTLLFTLLIIAPTLKAQEISLASWDEETLKTANTARDAAYLTEEEQKVIFFMNLARINGPLFLETILEAYIESEGMEENSYTRSLRKELKKLPPRQLLYPAKDLYNVAEGHASWSGKNSHVGHRGFDKRFKPLMGNPYNNVGENCSYGYDMALDIVISLLIDEGIPNLGHRVNILKENFNSVGVAIREHKRYRFNCVIDYGAK